MDALLVDNKVSDTDYEPNRKDLGPLSKELSERKVGYKQIPLKAKTLTFKLIGVLPEAVHVYRLHMLDSDKYALRRVLFIQIEKTEDGETFIAKIPSLEVFGLGDTQAEAIKDFQLSLIENYEILKEEKDNLSNYLQSHFTTLTKVLRGLPCH